MITGKSHSVKMLAIAGLTLSLALLLPGPSFAEIGGIRINKEVTKNFEEYRFDPDYRYYFLNLENNPCAVMGLQKDYTIEDISWTEVSPTSNKFKHVIELVKRFPMARYPTTGADILYSQGKKIGVWYSGVNPGIVVDHQGKKVFITVQMTGPHHR